MPKPKSLKVIEEIAVPQPCSQTWESMQGDDRSRFCEQCAHSVMNLSALTKESAAALLEKRGTARMCVRYNTDRTGQILFKPTISRSTKFWQASAMVIAAVMTLVGLAPAISAEDQDAARPDVANEGHTIGIVAPPTAVATAEPNRYPEVLGDIGPPPNINSPTPPQPQGEIVGKMIAPVRK